MPAKDWRLQPRAGPPVSGGSERFTNSYDGLSRLTAVGTTNPESFSYDAATNIASRTGPAATYSHDTANRVTGDGARSFTWSAADRLTGRGADSFAYDPLGRMTGSTVAATARSYAYNGDGLLGSRTQGGSTTSFLWDTATAPAPLLQAGTDRVVQGLGPLYLVRANGTTQALARDGLGSVRAEVSQIGAVSKSFRYAAYGALVQNSGGSPTLLGYAGELADPSGLVYLRARWYDPGTGRFTTSDSDPGSAILPPSLNPFAYVSGKPVTNTDPSGRFCIPCAGAIVGGIAGLAGYIASTAATGGEFRFDQAAIATGVGAISGAACTGGVIAGCVVISAGVSAVQYHFMTGDKTAGGYALSGLVGATAGKLTYSKRFGFSYEKVYAKRLLDPVVVWSERVRAGVSNFGRSFVVNTLGGVVSGSADAAGPGDGPPAYASGIGK